MTETEFAMRYAREKTISDAIEDAHCLRIMRYRLLRWIAAASSGDFLEMIQICSELEHLGEKLRFEYAIKLLSAEMEEDV